MRTRFDKANCFAGCASCNQFDNHHLERFEARLIQEFGFDFVTGLRCLQQLLWKFTPSDLIDLIQEYKTKLKELK
jgi:hypothetical protein